MTGWNLPPGVTTRMIDEQFGGDEVCECCGRHCDDCICPECPICGEQGNPKCYVNTADDKGHAGDYTKEQLIGQAKLKIARLKEQIQDEEMCIAQLEEPDEYDPRDSDANGPMC